MPWKRGESGNPKGKAQGTRTGVCDAFVRDLHDDWRKHGKAALAACRKEEPATYVRVVAGLLPKETNANLNMNAGESLERLIAIIDRLDSDGVKAAVAACLDSEQEQPAHIRH